jgi:PEP-CTERM motif
MQPVQSSHDGALHKFFKPMGNFMKLKSLVATAVLAIAATSSFAGTVAPNSTTLTGFQFDTFTTLASDNYSSLMLTLGTSGTRVSNVFFDTTSLAFDADIGGFQFSGPISVGTHTLTGDISAKLKNGVYQGLIYSVDKEFSSSPVAPTMGTIGTSTGAVNVVSAPVPEPETYAMLIAGLGVLGFVGRRRKAK